MCIRDRHWLGIEGFPRRYADYKPGDGFTGLNELSSIGAFVLGASTLPFLYNVWKSRLGPKVLVDDPWGWGRSLEWATSCPPPRHNFTKLPRIRSESPAFDLHHPEVALLELEHSNQLNSEGEAADTSEMTGRTSHLEEQVEEGRAERMGQGPQLGGAGHHNPLEEGVVGKLAKEQRNG